MLKNWKQSQVAIATTIVIGIVINLIGVGIAYLLADKLESGDILSFEGAVLGAAGAVVGAVFLEDRKRRDQAQAEQQPVLDAVSNFRTALSSQLSAEKLEDMYVDEISEAQSILQSIYGFYPPKNPRLMSARKAADEAVTSYLKAARHTIEWEAAQYPKNNVPEDVKNRLKLAVLRAQSLLDAHRGASA